MKRRKQHKIIRLFLRRGNSSLTVRILLLDISLPLFEVVSQTLKVSDEFHSKEKALTPAEKTPSSEAPCHTTRRHFCQLGHSHMQEIHIPSTVRLLWDARCFHPWSFLEGEWNQWNIGVPRRKEDGTEKSCLALDSFWKFVAVKTVEEL